MQDYYTILDVHPTADLDTIKKAFRLKAQQCHPDRGGSHDAMVLVNEAWFVLSDAVRRAEYDAVRNNSSSASTHNWETHTEEVRSKARGFATDWTTFSNWMDSALEDVSKATYQQSGWLPDIRHSSTGKTAIAIGGVIGAFVAMSMDSMMQYRDALLTWMAGEQPHWPWGKEFNLLKVVLYPIALPLVGAWVGYCIHWLINQYVVRSIRSKGLREKSRVVACPKCDQQLRIPHHDHTLTVTCQACGIKVDVSPSLPPAPRALLTRRRGILASLGAAVGFLVAVNVSMQAAQHAATKILKDIPESTIQLFRTGDLEKRIHQMEGFAIAHGGEDMMEEKNKAELKKLRVTRDFMTQLVHQADAWTNSTYLDRIEMFPMVYVICMAIGAGLGGLMGFAPEREPPDDQGTQRLRD